MENVQRKQNKKKKTRHGKADFADNREKKKWEQKSILFGKKAEKW